MKTQALIFFLGLSFLIGCGVKAPPLPPEGRETEADEAIVDLTEKMPGLVAPDPSPSPSAKPAPHAKKKKKHTGP